MEHPFFVGLLNILISLTPKGEQNRKSEAVFFLDTLASLQVSELFSNVDNWSPRLKVTGFTKHVGAYPRPQTSWFCNFYLLPFSKY